MPEPVQLDFSKAVPVGKDEGVQLDFSKAVPLDSTGQTAPTAPQGSPVSRLISSAIAPIKGAATGLYQAATTLPQTTTEKVVNAFGPGALFLKRTLVDPAIEQGKQAAAEFGQSAPTSLSPTQEQLWHRQKALGHGLAAIIPGFGPMAATAGEKIGEQVGTGDYAGALGTGLGNTALVLAPKAIGAAGTSTTVPRVLRPLIEKTQEAQKAATEAADEYQNAVKQKTGEIAADQAAKNQDAAQKAIEAKKLQDQALEEYNRTLKSKTEEVANQQAKGRLSAMAQDVEQQRTHQQSVAETKAANEAAVKQQSKIAPTQGKLENSVQEMQAQVETARNNALKEGNKKYNAVNKELNQVPADSSAINDAAHDSLSKITGTYSEPSIIKSIKSRLDNGDNLSYEDLQGYYTELGRELSKGSLPGDLYQAYDTMQEAIGDDMQRIADANGKGAQLTDARNYWRRMKQAFGKPYNPTDAGNVVLDKTAGGIMRQAEYENRLRLLGSFDKTIPQTAQHIANLQKGVESLPKPQPIRNILKPLPEKPAPVPAPTFEGTPEELARQSVTQPKGVEMPTPPKFEGTPEELAKQKTPLPKSTGKTVIDQADIENAKRGKLLDDAESVRTKGWWGATVLSLYALRGVLHGDFSGAMVVPFDIGGTMAVTHAISQLMQRPSVVNFLTKATAKDIAAIPPELRGDLPKLVEAAKKRGIPVSATLAALGGATQQKPVAAALQTQ